VSDLGLDVLDERFLSGGVFKRHFFSFYV
jgi:hypothetical protein